MYLVISHIPSDDINCPGIEPGPLGATPFEAIEAWKEARLTAYEEGGAKDPDWDPDQPDSYEGMIIDLASDLRNQVEISNSAYAFADDEQAYLVQVPAMPESMVAGGRTIDAIDRYNGKRFYVTETVVQAPVSGAAGDLTGRRPVGDFATQAEALVAFPGARLGIGTRQAA
jgi:hypothetical protein